MSKLLRPLFFASVPVAMLCAMVFVGSIGDKNTDFSSFVATLSIVVAYACAMLGLVRDNAWKNTPLAKLYFSVWAYAVVLFCGVAAFMIATGDKPIWTPP